MIIETKFDKGDVVFVIEDDDIISLPVMKVSYEDGVVLYSFLKRKSTTLMDRDIIIHRAQKNCFKSIDELATFYKNKNT